MGLMKQAYDTYCALEAKYAGVYESGKEPLSPISHQVVNADIEITLNSEGALLGASLVDKSNAQIIIPVTETSAGRTGETNSAHPLCDQLRFFSPIYPEKYSAFLTQLHQWENSPYGHPKLAPIARYVEKGTILEDLERFGLISRNKEGFPTKEKQMVCWRVESGNPNEIAECWRDRTLFHSFINYYASTKRDKPVFCMVSGQKAVPACQHPKKIINTSANAKLISAKDAGGFTYRGRFTDDTQAMTMSYDASQKIHNALHWLAATQGVYIGGRTFLFWNPQRIEIPKAHTSIRPRNATKQFKYSDYKKDLENALRGWKEKLPADADAVIAAFDAATSGRLSVTYYSEMIVTDFLERLHHWEKICCWEHAVWGIQSPDLYCIVNYAFGTPRTSNGKTIFDTDERIMRQYVQRLLSCRIDKAFIPKDIVCAIVTRASNLQILNAEKREDVLFTACAVLRKNYFDRCQEEWNMALEPEKKDISYQYGRLLAVLEKTERDTFAPWETREPNAIRLQPVFTKRPQHTFTVIMEQLKKAYYPKLRPGARVNYERLIGEIMEQISQCPQSGYEEALKDTYLFGYYLQKNTLYTSKNNESNQEVEQ